MRERRDNADCGSLSECELYKHIYKSFIKQKSEIYLNILEEDATELMLEECTSSSHDKLQLAVKVSMPI